MKINKYLKELGLDWCDLPGNYDGKLHNCGITKLENSAAADPRNKMDDEGFCEYEFFSLDYSMALYIYPRLCKFRDEYAKFGTPGCFCYNKNGEPIKDGNKKWLKTLDKMILAFKCIILDPADVEHEKKSKIVNRGLTLFAQYYNCLWY